jgi:hypothetical protein
MPSRAFESQEAHSIRFKPSDWKLFEEAARAHGVELSVIVRNCALVGLRTMGSTPLMTAAVSTPLVEQIQYLLAVVARGREAEALLRTIQTNISSSGVVN